MQNVNNTLGQAGEMETPVWYKDVTEDIFQDDGNNSSLVHFVSANMTSLDLLGEEFLTRYGCVDKILQSDKKPGDVATIRDNSRYVFYLLVTQETTDGIKKEYIDSAIERLFTLVTQLGVKFLRMGRMTREGTELTWDYVRLKMLEVFTDGGVNLTICWKSQRPPEEHTEWIYDMSVGFYKRYKVEKTSTSSSSVKSPSKSEALKMAEKIVEYSESDEESSSSMEDSMDSLPEAKPAGAGSDSDEEYDSDTNPFKSPYKRSKFVPEANPFNLNAKKVDVSVPGYKWLMCTRASPHELNILKTWLKVLPSECTKALDSIYLDLCRVISERNQIYPDICYAMLPFTRILPKDVDLVIVGQSPYKNGTATGIPITSMKSGEIIMTPSTRVFKAAIAGCLPDVVVPNNCMPFYYTNGVLVLNASFTGEWGRDKRYEMFHGHEMCWGKFMFPFMRYCMSQKICLLMLGKLAQTLTRDIAYQFMMTQEFPTERPDKGRAAKGGQEFSKNLRLIFITSKIVRLIKNVESYTSSKRSEMDVEIGKHSRNSQKIEASYKQDIREYKRAEIHKIREYLKKLTEDMPNPLDDETIDQVIRETSESYHKLV